MLSRLQLSRTRGQWRRAAVHWLKIGLGAVAGLELGYLAVFNIWVPSRLVSFAQKHEVDLPIVGFRTLYPGNVSAKAVHLSGPNRSFEINTKAAHGRVKLGALLGGSVDLAWLSIAGIEVRVGKPDATLLASSRSGTKQRPQDTAYEAAMAALPSLRQVHVDRAKREIASAELGSFTLTGPVEVRTTLARFSEGQFEMGGFAHLSQAHAKRGAAARDAPAAVLDGDVAWKVLPRNAESRSDETRMVLRASLRWKAANLGALLGTDSAFEAREAHLGVELRMHDGAARSGSYLELQAAELLPPPLSVAPSSALFRQARLRMEFRTPVHAGDPVAGSLSLQSADVEFGFHGQPQHFSFAGKATVDELNTGAPSVLLGAGQFRARRAESLGPPAGTQQPLSLTLTLARASWSSSTGLGLSGKLVARGSDASALLDLGAPDPGARWMLSELVQSPFTLGLELLLRPDRIALEDISLVTSRIDARGALFLGDAGANGAFLFKRGKLKIGVEVEPDTMKLNLGANSDWLERSVTELRAAQASSP